MAERLVFERAGQIFIAGADGVGASQLPRLPRRLIDHYGDSWPTFSPDGKSVAVFLGEQGRYGDYWILPSDGRRSSPSHVRPSGGRCTSLDSRREGARRRLGTIGQCESVAGAGGRRPA